MPNPSRLPSKSITVSIYLPWSFIHQYICSEFFCWGMCNVAKQLPNMSTKEDKARASVFKTHIIVAHSQGGKVIVVCINDVHTDYTFRCCPCLVCTDPHSDFERSSCQSK